MRILDNIPSEAKIKSQIRKIIYGSRLRCPRCRSSHVRASETRYRCSKCRRPFSLTSHSWLRYKKISYQTLWLLILCWQQRISFETTQDITGCSHIAVRRWFRRFQRYLAYKSPVLKGEIEVDEAFIGRRKHKNQKVVLGAYERHTKRVVLQRTHDRAQGTTDRFLLKHIDTSSIVYTDSAHCYHGIDSFFGYIHRRCNHAEGYFGPTNHIEAVWSKLKRYIRRTYHHYHTKHLPLLLREFEARINIPHLFTSPSVYLSNSLTPVPFG